MMAGHLNGSGRHEDDPKIASLDVARKRQAERLKDEKRAAREVKRGGSMSIRDWVIGVAFVAMALGMIWHWLAPLVRSSGAFK